MIRSIRRNWVGAAVVLACSTWAWAVKPATWDHAQPKDFEDGTFEDVVVTSDGRLQLGRTVEVLQDTKDEAVAVNALARGPDGAVYAATGGSGTIYRVREGKASVLVKLPDPHVFSLVFGKDGMLLAGTGGERARIYRVDADGKFEVFFEPSNAKYVWAMVRGAEGEIYAATGVDGSVVRIEPTGKDSKVLTKIKDKNVLCLAADKAGMLYAGTDKDGLVYRIDPKDGKAYVLYDAEEPEIAAIAVDSDMNVYAATAAAAAAKPGRSLGEKAGGKPDKPTTAPASARATMPSAAALLHAAASAAGKTPTAGGGPSSGNAIYRINRDGFVTEVFREPVMVLSLAWADGTLYAATGNEGRLYEIVPEDELVTNIARVKGSQATALLRLDDGTLIVGTANECQIVRVAPGFAHKGTYTSAPLDAKQIVRFGRLRWDSMVPEGTTLRGATRSGNVKDPESQAWSDWSEPFDATAGAQVPSPGARFLQYRLSLETTKDAVTPAVSEVEVFRLEDNRPPTIASLKVGAANELAKTPQLAMIKAKMAQYGPLAATSSRIFAAAWQASDPNGDELEYQVSYRPVGSQRWVDLSDDPIREPMLVWDSVTIADGRYEFRVVAKDSPDNPPASELSFSRLSEPVLIDNTPPVIRVERIRADGHKVQVRLIIKDALSPLVSAGYTINSNDDWKAVMPDDDIFDSLEEVVEFTVEDLKPGEQRLAFRAADRAGNVVYETRSVVVE